MRMAGRQGSAVCRANRAPGISRSSCCHILLHILFPSHASNIFIAVRLLIPRAQLIFGYNFARLTLTLLLFVEAPTRRSAGAPSRRKRNTTGELLWPAAIVIVAVSILFRAIILSFIPCCSCCILHVGSLKLLQANGHLVPSNRCPRQRVENGTICL